MKIIVVGYGYVGKAMVELLTNKYDVDVYDPLFPLGRSPIGNQRMIFISKEQQQLNHYDLAVICVPSPMKENGECDDLIVASAVNDTNADIYLIKSTIAPGTSEMWSKSSSKNIVFSPEYVGESKYYNPYFPNKMIEVPFHIFGGKKEHTSKVIEILMPILGPVPKYLQMTSTEAEIVKYMENTFFATKVTYCQEMYDICQKVGADWATVREGWLLDPRINPMHTAVFENDRGFGGKCYPKDTNAMAEFMRKSGVEPIILDAVLKKNKELRK